MTSLADAYAAVAFTRETFGRARRPGQQRRLGPWWTSFVQNETAFWDKVIDINFKGQLNFCRAAFEAFVEQETAGRIVNMAIRRRPGGLQDLEVVYSACKGGVIAMTKALAREGVRYKVLVNAVAPGLTDTPLVAGLDQKVMEAIIKAHPACAAWAIRANRRSWWPSWPAAPTATSPGRSSRSTAEL